MERRDFLKAAGVGAIASATAFPAPAIAQSAPEIRWRMPSSFPKATDAIYGSGEQFARAVAEMTDNKFQIQPFAPGEIVPALQVLDAAQNGTVECCHTASYYYVGKDPTFQFGTCMPFGMNARGQNAWLLEAGGQKLLDEFYAGYNLVAFPAGNTGAQMGGWFRKEIKSVADLQGLKKRTSGLAGQILSKLGVVPQQIAAGDIYPALERGTIDAAEWVGPYDDEKLGFARVAPYYYYPGWWEGGPTLHLFINQAKWNELPKTYQAVVRTAAHLFNERVLTAYDVKNPAALRRLVANGAQLRPFPRDVLEATFKSSFELYADLSAKNPAWKKVYDPYMAFRGEANLWFRVAENTFDNFVYAQQARG